MHIIIIIIIFHTSEISALGGCWGLDSNYCPGWMGLKFIIIFNSFQTYDIMGPAAYKAEKFHAVHRDQH
jgi:hypothetical protein